MSTPSAVYPQLAGTSASTPQARPLGRIVMHWVRRLHLYFGLFLFPWAVLYGFTGFLFNHPPIMNPQSIRSFDRSAWSGTSMETPADLQGEVRQVIQQLQSRGEAAVSLKWIESEPVRFAGEFAFGKIETDHGEISLLFDAMGNGGTIRQGAPKPVQPIQKASFEVVAPVAPPSSVPEFLHRLDSANTLTDRLKSSAAKFAESQNLTGQPVVITSVPDLLFVVEADGQRWRAAYNSLKGTLTAKPFAAVEPLPWRNFLLRLHTTHVYPFSFASTKWLWVLGADVMGLVLVYWGVSGLLMWWQIKSTRRWGFVILALSTIAATLLAFGMHGTIHVG